MKLTHRAKGDFSYKYNMSNFNEYSEVLQNALIIEFFDSIKCVGFKSLWSYVFGNHYDPFSDNWNEYIEKAIEKANLIYNDRV